MSSTREPHVRCFQNGAVIHFRLAEWEALNHALDTHQEWFVGESIYGNEIRVRCATITDIHFVDRRALAGADDDHARDVLTSDDT